MATNLQIDDHLIERAVKLGHHRTKRAAVTQALTEYVNRLEQQSILSLFGTVEYDEAYDFKKQRAKTWDPDLRRGRAQATRHPHHGQGFL